MIDIFHVIGLSDWKYASLTSTTLIRKRLSSRQLELYELIRTGWYVRRRLGNSSCNPNVPRKRILPCIDPPYLYLTSWQGHTLLLSGLRCLAAQF